MSEPEPRPGQAPVFDPLVESKRILRATRAGTLATVNATGDPFASLVTVATNPDGSPLILVSQLSAHTRHMDKDPRVSLLLAETGQGDPLAHPRLTAGATKRSSSCATCGARTRRTAPAGSPAASSTTSSASPRCTCARSSRRSPRCGRSGTSADRRASS